MGSPSYSPKECTAHYTHLSGLILGENKNAELHGFRVSPDSPVCNRVHTSWPPRLTWLTNAHIHARTHTHTHKCTHIHSLKQMHMHTDTHRKNTHTHTYTSSHTSCTCIHCVHICGVPLCSLFVFCVPHKCNFVPHKYDGIKAIYCVDCSPKFEPHKKVFVRTHTHTHQTHTHTHTYMFRASRGDHQSVLEFLTYFRGLCYSSGRAITGLSQSEDLRHLSVCRERKYRTEKKRDGTQTSVTPKSRPFQGNSTQNFCWCTPVHTHTHMNKHTHTHRTSSLLTHGTI